MAPGSPTPQTRVLPKSPGLPPGQIRWTGNCLPNDGSGADCFQRLEALRTVPKADVFRGPFPTGRSKNGLVRRGCSASFPTGLSHSLVRGRAPEPIGKGDSANRGVMCGRTVQSQLPRGDVIPVRILPEPSRLPVLPVAPKGRASLPGSRPRSPQRGPLSPQTLDEEWILWGGR